MEKLEDRIRPHSPPKVCFTGGLSPMGPKQQYYYQRSKARYDASPDGKRANELMLFSLSQGEIGRYEGVRLITHE